MGLMTALPYGRPLTADDLQDIPDDGHRYELLDGSLLVTPAPGWKHQSVQASLHMRLRAACPRGFRVVGAPFEWRERASTALQPDILVAAYGDLAAVPRGRYLGAPPVLVVEVLSPSTRRIDRMAKFSAYQDAGIPSYWLVDPDPERPELSAYELRPEGRYALAVTAAAAETFRVERPYPVEFAVLDLAEDLRPD